MDTYFNMDRSLYEKRFCEAPDIITTNGLGKVGSGLWEFTGWDLEISFEKFGVADNDNPKY